MITHHSTLLADVSINLSRLGIHIVTRDPFRVTPPDVFNSLINDNPSNHRILGMMSATWGPYDNGTEWWEDEDVRTMQDMSIVGRPHKQEHNHNRLRKETTV